MVVAIILLIWDLFGIMAFVMQAMMTEEMLTAMPAEDQEIYRNTPSWITGAYFVAVFGATLGSLALILKKKWAMPLFILSLIAVIVQMSYTLFAAGVLELKGATSAIFPLIIVFIGAYQIILSNQAIKKNWIV